MVGNEIKMYDFIKHEELNKLFENAKILIKGREGVKNDLSYVMSFYSQENSFAGFTDYTDHRNDTLLQVEKMIKDALENRCMQNGNYYNIDGKPFDLIIVQLKNGGWGASAKWSDGSCCFFSSQIKRKSKEKPF